MMRETHGYLLGLAQRGIDPQLRTRVSASDIVQETMLEAVRDLDGFQGNTSGEFVAWLRSIMQHNLARGVERHVLTAKRDLRREVSLEKLSLDNETAVGLELNRLADVTSGSPSFKMRRQESHEELARAVDRLSADYRTVILLRHWEGLPFPEIAEQIGRSAPATRMLWIRAVDQLRDFLGEDDSR
ncbi:MAG: sigma-70 family RNA polymerase sigma factor [Rubripirellula sp.]